MTLEQWLEPGRDQASEESEPARRPRVVTALEAFAQHRELTLLGKPGSGKSTFGAHVLLMLAHAWMGDGQALGKLGASWNHGALLPIRVVLRRFAEQLPAGESTVRAGDLWEFIGRDFIASGYGQSKDILKYVMGIARQHGALILLDGLDECGTPARRARVVKAVDEFRRTAAPKCRFVTTARPYAWPEDPDPARGVYVLADLNDQQIEWFINGWYGAVVTQKWLSPAEGQQKIADLIRARERSDLKPLTQNPLLLTLMAALNTNRGRLPDDRVDLYNESVDLLMTRWNQKVGADKALLDELNIPSLKLSDLREVLEELAFKLHERDVSSEGSADIREGPLVGAFQKLLKSKDKADVVVDYIEKRAGLLVGQGERDNERHFTFPHRTFREFLAACHLAALPDFPSECRRLARSAPAHWQVVLPMAARLAKAERGASAADELIKGDSVDAFLSRGTPDHVDWTCARLAGAQLLEIGLSAIETRERTQAIARRVARWLEKSLPVHTSEGGVSGVQRALAGDVLASLGDPRFEPKLFHLPGDKMLGFVKIPADPSFRIGTSGQHAIRVGEILGASVPRHEINDDAVETPEFYISRYAITVSQFKAFVDASGHKIGDSDALLGPGNLPVRWVSWHEALAYCNWMNEVLVRELADSVISPLIRSGEWSVSLPSELEWEKAARGDGNTVFPWGDDPDSERANYRNTRIDVAAPVGCFPDNHYGLFDMVGNVFAWTRSLWGVNFSSPTFRYPYKANDPLREDSAAGDNVLRVVRGGSWLSSLESTRCGSRERFHPHLRNDYVGFRVVVVPATGAANGRCV